MTHAIRKYMTLIETVIMESKTIYLEPNLVPPQLKRGYNGKKFKAVVTERVTIPSDAGSWGGGSRETYRIIRLEDGQEMPASNDTSAPWDRSRQDRVIELEPGIAVVMHSIFLGKDSGLTFYVHPRDAVTLLPRSDSEITDIERKVLNLCGYKPSYRQEERRRQGISDEDYEATRQSLLQKGLIDKRGAITNAGRNV